MSDDHEKYLLRVTAGPDYDPATHQIVPVNAPEAIEIENEHMTARLNVRIQGYRGLPHGSPSTNPYFSDPAHTHDQYSIAFSFLPKKPIPGNDLVFGNDLDRPIRDRLPPGFSSAVKIATWLIDPGLEGDPYADKPHLYGPALSSLNVFRIGEKVSEKACENERGKLPATVNDNVIQEGADGDGETIRSELSIPADAEKRKKYFLQEKHRQGFEFEEGRVYQADFFNPYIVFNDFSVKLPGFSVSVLKYVDEKNHELRYVLKNRKTGDVIFVVLFTLLFTDTGTPPSNNGSRSSSRRSLLSRIRKTSPSGSAGSHKDDPPHSNGNADFIPNDDDVD